MASGSVDVWSDSQDCNTLFQFPHTSIISSWSFILHLYYTSIDDFSMFKSSIVMTLHYIQSCVYNSVLLLWVEIFLKCHGDVCRKVESTATLYWKGPKITWYWLFKDLWYTMQYNNIETHFETQFSPSWLYPITEGAFTIFSI